MSTDYSNIALFYDLATLRALAPVRRRIVELLRGAQIHNDAILPAAGEQAAGPEPAPGARALRVLDIGCGTGVQLAYLSEAGFDCAGADESSQMLARAAKRCPGSCLLAPDAAGVSEAGTQNSGPDEGAARPDSRKHGNGCCLAQAQADNLPFADGSFDVAILSLILHESEADPQKILAEAARVASRVLVVEWKMPERNLDYLYWLPMHIIERMAGKRHFRNFRAYMRSGALEGLVYRYNLRARENGTALLESAGYEFFRLGSLVLMDLRKKAL